MSIELNKQQAYKEIEKLIKKFESNYNQYVSQSYDETKTRIDFIDQFFGAFGWDISNKNSLSETYRDVIHEYKIRIDGRIKSSDYAFKTGGKGVFLLEAKKPSVNLKDDTASAYQIRRYAWNAKLGIGILSNFKETAIYNCVKKPYQNDKAYMYRIEYMHYKDYLERFDFLYDTFAKENVIKGSLEKYNDYARNKKGTESVDDDFVCTLDNFRLILASNISKLNGWLYEEDLNSAVRHINFAVQHIIDRIVFLRVAEARGLENEYILKNACLEGDNFYKNIVEIFKNADGKYNSGIFDFSKDKITINEKFKVDNNVIKKIINELYYPQSPYLFSIIPIEIIGHAYEQFLGKIIAIGKNHKAKLEYKPEVKKAGGVYYTPEYIVDYIVGNTVGKIIKGKSPKEISKIKILDPACGSGSFLLGAYKYLLNYHREYYSNKNSKKYITNGKLNLRLKKQILINNIFGVDIDSNAVEVAKLSLLMTCLEEETQSSIMDNKSLFNERALPSLDENIKCGNSLIGNNFYKDSDMLNMDIETQYKINCFDWDMEFYSILKNGGFDIVIGNPPYVSIRTVDFNNEYKDYFENKYNLALGQYDLYSLFTELSYNILNQRGIYGFILPKRLATNENFQSLRDFYINKFNIIEYADAGKPFLGASVEANIIIASKSKSSDFVKIGIFDKSEYNHFQNMDKKFIDIMPFQIFPFLIKNDNMKLLDKIKSANYSNLGLHCGIIRGFECGFNNPKIDKKKSKYKIIRGENIHRYIVEWSDYYVHPDFKNEAKIFKREEIFTKTPKLLTKFVSNNIEFALDEIGYCNTNVVYNVHIKDNTNIKYY